MSTPSLHLSHPLKAAWTLEHLGHRRCRSIRCHPRLKYPLPSVSWDGETTTGRGYDGYGIYVYFWALSMLKPRFMDALTVFLGDLIAQFLRKYRRKALNQGDHESCKLGFQDQTSTSTVSPCNKASSRIFTCHVWHPNCVYRNETQQNYEMRCEGW